MKPNPISLGRKALVQHLQSVTVENGYSTNAGHNVKTGWLNEVLETEKANLPLICIQKGKDLPPKPGPGGLIKFNGYSVVGVIKADLNEYEDALDDLERDLLLALVPGEGATSTWLPFRSGIKGITVGAPEQFPPGNGEGAASVLIPVHLHTIIER